MKKMTLEKDIVESLRCRLPDYLRSSGRMRGRGKLHCINPEHDDREPSMAYDSRRNRLHCFGCGKSYDLFDVIAIDFPECDTFLLQVQKACELFEVKAAGKPSGKRVIPHSVAVRGDYTAFVEDSIKRCGIGGPYFSMRGISQALCQKHRLFERDGRAYFPIFQEGRCVAFCARSIDGKGPRYLNSPGKMPLFGGDLLKDQNGGDLVVTESAFDALAAEECGVEAVALCGAGNTERFLQACAANSALRKKRFLLAGDQDAAGDRMNRALEAGLKALNMRFARITLPKGAKDLNEALLMDREALERSLRAPDVEYNVQSAASILEGVRAVRGDLEYSAISTGLRGLDKLLDGGLFPGLYVLGAISSLGKTSLALQIADGIAESGHDVLYFTLEMSRMELISRSLSRMSWQLDGAAHTKALTMRQILSGQRSAPLERAAEKYTAGPGTRIFFFEESVSVKEIRKAAERHIQARNKKPVVIVDYLQILKPADGRATDKQNTDRAVVELKRISRAFSIPVLAISSFNRENYRNVVSMEAFKESGAVEYSSDVLLGMQLSGAGEPRFDVNAAKMRTPRKLELVLLKNRGGAPYGVLPLRYDAKYSIFLE